MRARHQPLRGAGTGGTLIRVNPIGTPGQAYTTFAGVSPIRHVPTWLVIGGLFVALIAIHRK